MRTRRNICTWSAPCTTNLKYNYHTTKWELKGISVHDLRPAWPIWSTITKQHTIQSDLNKYVLWLYAYLWPVGNFPSHDPVNRAFVSGTGAVMHRQTEACVSLAWRWTAWFGHNGWSWAKIFLTWSPQRNLPALFLVCSIDFCPHWLCNVSSCIRTPWSGGAFVCTVSLETVAPPKVSRAKTLLLMTSPPTCYQRYN